MTVMLSRDPGFNKGASRRASRRLFGSCIAERPKSLIGSFSRLVLVGVAVAGVSAAARAQLSSAPSSSPWLQEKSRVRLVSAGGLAAGSYRLGLDVALSPGVLTYWSYPGEAGVPPTFDFSGSQNVAPPRVSYPAPTRILEDGTTAYGWRDEVLFPIDVSPVDPAKTSVVRVIMRYATCDTICIPAEASESIDLAPYAPATPAADMIAYWRSRVPRPLPAPLTPSIRPLPGPGDARWRVAFPDSDGPGDLFVVGGDGWFFASRPLGAGVFEVALKQKPPSAGTGPVSADLTYVEGDQAFYKNVSFGLDGAASGGQSPAIAAPGRGRGEQQ